MKIRTLIAASAAALLLAGCGSSTKPAKPRHTATSGPFSSVTPPTKSKPICLTLTPSYGGSEGAAGHQYVTLELKNDTAQACSTQGFPTLTLLGKSGKTLGQAADYDSVRPIERVDLKPGASALVEINFPNPGNFDPGKCKTGAATLRIQLPAGGKVVKLTDTTHAPCPGWSNTVVHSPNAADPTS